MIDTLLPVTILAAIALFFVWVNYVSTLLMRVVLWIQLVIAAGYSVFISYDYYSKPPCVDCWDFGPGWAIVFALVTHAIMFCLYMLLHLAILFILHLTQKRSKTNTSI